MFRFLLCLSTAAALFTDCAHGTGAFHIDELSARPNDIVQRGQSVTFHLVYTVPQGLYIPSANVAMTMTVDNYVMPIRRSAYAHNSIFAGQHNYTTRFAIPLGVSGRIRAVANFYNVSGEQLMCTRWDATVPYASLYTKKKWSLFG